MYRVLRLVFEDGRRLLEVGQRLAGGGDQLLLTDVTLGPESPGQLPLPLPQLVQGERLLGGDARLEDGHKLQHLSAECQLTLQLLHGQLFVSEPRKPTIGDTKILFHLNSQYEVK